MKSRKKKVALAIGEVEIKEKLGQGGNGVVYSGQILGETLAFKFLLSNTSGESLGRKNQRFLAEYFNVMTLSDLKGLVRYVDYDIYCFEDEEGEVEIPVIIMKEYAGALERNDSAPSEKEFISLFNFLTNSIERLHNQGIIHRDLKPENILRDGEGYVIADFGIASFNPEIFKVRADTEKGERIGNRLFSAPEQEISGVEGSPTMDIYSIGQVLQWYATGETHRGTGRKNIPYRSDESIIYNQVIEICLSNNPKNRFQNINEIREYIENKKEKDIFEYFRIFSFCLRSSFPKNNSGLFHSDEYKKIARFFGKLKEKEKEFRNRLWWHDGMGNIDITLNQNKSGQWKINDIEYNIKEIWGYYDNSLFNDFVLIHYIPSEPFNIYENDPYFMITVDDKYEIEYSELENGYADIGDDVIKLSNHKVERTERMSEEGYFFIGTEFHCVLYIKNDRIVSEFIDRITLDQGKIGKEELMEFQKSIRKNKRPEVWSRL
ncbi:protein kinase [Echinicola sp. 20G]|uniref:protein kinase domain-containing protein n=1 Tax=Echinicola sp. 20G TaxID=2781961 RepID=UPI0019108FED|nr:protein kinase [Echinicola sp. 20G]